MLLFSVRSVTCTFLGAPGLLAVHPELASEILLPEFSEPDVAPVVGERAAPEVPVERWRGEERSEGEVNEPVTHI